MSKAVRVGTMALGGLVAVMSMAACGTAFGQDKKADAPAAAQSTAPSSSASGSHSPAPGKSAGTGNGSGNGTGTGGNNGNGTNDNNRNGTNGHGGPEIVSFTVVQQPRCASGTTKYETPAVPAKVSWKVTGATGIAMSVDDPHRVGSYGNYEAEGTLEFTFSCGGAVGSTETHQYTLTTVGGSGQAKSKTLTVSTKVLEKGTQV
jgi:hypothetical protein